VWQIRAGHHWDTASWALQVITGVGILVMASIHMWVVLTDLPVLAEKSGARVVGEYLWIYIPFIVFAEFHTTTGLYRMAVKWGIASRHVAHRILLVWTLAVLALGFAILIAFYRVGGDV
jgi:fumarate reductase subunit C